MPRVCCADRPVALWKANTPVEVRGQLEDCSPRWPVLWGDARSSRAVQLLGRAVDGVLHSGAF